MYDWKFPAERRDLDGQFAYLASLAPEQLAKAMAAFAQLRLTPALEKTDWVNSPAVFTEQLTAHFWTTHQIDALPRGGGRVRREIERRIAGRPAADASVGNRRDRAGRRKTISTACSGSSGRRARISRRSSSERAERAGRGGGEASRRAPGALRPLVHRRRRRRPAIPDSVARVSYAALSPARAALQSRMQKIYEASVFDPGGVSNPDGADAARRHRLGCRRRRGAEPVPAQPADGRLGDAGLRDDLCAMGGARSAAARAAAYAVGRGSRRGSARTR